MKNTAIHLNQLAWSTLLAAVASSLINSPLFLLFAHLGWINSEILANGQPITITGVVFSSVISTLLAALVFYIIGLIARNPYRSFTLISGVLFLFFFLNPFVAIPGISFKMGLALDVLHVPVWISILIFFKRSLTDKSHEAK